MNTYKFHEFDIPIDLLNMTGGGVDTFEEISDGHINNLKKFVGIYEDHNILEIGCGIGRDAIPLTKIISNKGAYLGIDIIKPSIDFCTINIKSKYPNFDFIHFDIKDQLHNPNGIRKTVDIRLPIPDRSIDRVIGWSVFTHLYATDIQHYLNEISRVLKPNGLAYLTVFIVDEAILHVARKESRTIYNLKFEHKLTEDCYINNQQCPLGAVAYTRDSLFRMIKAAGLELQRDFLRGSWSGFYSEPQEGQDAMVLRIRN